jgi:hypothetical protein
MKGPHFMYTDFKSLFVFAYDLLLETSFHLLLKTYGRIKSIGC